MVNGIIGGIAAAISNEFGDDYTIYTEEIKQELPLFGQRIDDNS